MKTAITLFLLCISQLMEAQDFVGDWYGILDVQGVKLNIVVHIENENDSLQATLDSPDQSTYGIPVNKIDIEGDSIYFEIQVIGASYSGMMDGDSIIGDFKQAGYAFDLNLSKEGEIVKPNRPQEPKPPYPYIVEEVKFESDSNVILAGTLTFPEGSGPFPAVVLISGSGPQNRDEELMGHKPFHVIADYFTRKGIVVLRYDDRGFAESTGDFGSATSEDLARDVKGAVDYLKSRSKIEHSRIGLVGHSEGGLLAPMVAANHPDDIACIVLMAGPGVPGHEIIYEQVALMGKAEGLSDDETEFLQSLHAKAYQLLNEHSDNKSFRKSFRDYIEARFNEEEVKEYQFYDERDILIDNMVGKMDGAWMRYFLNYDPKPTIMKVTCPTLAINGSMDLQVPPSNLEAISKALKAGGNNHFEIKEYENLNHLFQHSETGHLSEYMRIEETFSEEVMQDMVEWIKRQ